MGTIITEDEIKSYRELASAKLARRNTALIQQGFQAYLRDLPQLLREDCEGYMVAYCGDARVALARTERRLQRVLARQGFAGREGELFMTRVTVLDAEEFGVDIRR